MVTPRTHCHFTKQARALRVPELCDDHTPPSCLVTNSLAKLGNRSVNTLVLLDPLLTQGGPVTFLACTLHQLFVGSCNLAHHGLYCSHVCVCTQRSSSQHLLFCVRLRCFSVSTWTNPRACGCLLAPLSGITLTTRGNSLSALHSLQQLEAGATSLSPVQSSASTRESHGAAPSSSVSCPQLTLCAAHPQVQMDPTRTFTSDLLSATLAEAATQLSFAAFLERSPPPQLPVPTPPLDVATQPFLHTAATRDVSTQLSFKEFLAPPSTHDVLCTTCSRPVPSLLLDAVQRRNS